MHWHDTYFVVAHFHFIMVGGSLMAFLAALHYWFPKMFGRMYSEGWGLVAAALIVLGFIATFIPQFLLGNAGMPRRYYMYPERFQALHVRLDGGLVAAGVRLRASSSSTSSTRWCAASIAGDNPWGSRGYEWLTAVAAAEAQLRRRRRSSTADPHTYQEPGEEVEHVVI